MLSAKFELQPNEQIVDILRPHPLAYMSRYLEWLAVIGFGLVWDVVGGRASGWLSPQTVREPMLQLDRFLSTVGVHNTRFGMSLTSDYLSAMWVAVMWAVFMLTWGALVALVRLDIRRFVVIGGTGVICLGASLIFKSPMLAPVIGVVIALLAIAYLFVKLRSHIYVITDKRLILQKRLVNVVERYMLFDRLHDMMIRQDYWGKRFHFGTLIPVALPNLYRENQVVEYVEETATGRHTIRVEACPVYSKKQDTYVLYGVADPETVHAELAQKIQAAQQAHQAVRREDETRRLKFLKED
jgi:hypothetical protein